MDCDCGKCGPKGLWEWLDREPERWGIVGMMALWALFGAAVALM
jgi:hypothetical protein